MVKKFKDIVKKNPEPAKGKFGINPMDPWSVKYGIAEATDKKDRVTLDIPLLIRVLELAREDIKTDMDLHRVVEKLIQIRNKGVLTMKDYNTIAHIKENHIAIAMGKMLDDEGGMVLTQLEQLERAIAMIRSYVGKDYEKQLPAWVQAKVTLATDYIDTVGNYLISKNEKVTEAKDPCWTGYTQVGMKDKGGRQVPNCVPSKGVPKAKGYKEEVALDEEPSKRPSGADKFRKFMANRDKQHTEFMKGIEGKSHAEKMQAMMDKIKSNLNTEEVDLEEAKQHPYKFRATYHDPDTNEVTHYMDFTHRNLEAAKKHAKNSVLQRKDGKEDKLHSVVQMKEEVFTEMDKSQTPPGRDGNEPYDYNKGKWTRAKIMTSKDAVKDMGKELNKAFDKSPEQKKVKEEVELNEDNLDSIAKKHDMEFKRTTYGAGMKHKTKGEVSINRYGEWHHYPSGSKSSKAHGNSEGNFSSLDKHLSSLKEEVEQIKEFNKDTLKSYLNKSTEVRKLAKSNLKDIEKRPEMYKDNTDKTQQNIAAQAKKLKATIAKRTMGANRAFNRLHGVAEAADKKEMSKSARMIKSLYKKHNMTEDMTDWEKEDKSVQTYGKKPKIQTTPKKDSFGEDKPKAAIIMSGGKTMTGQTRDTVEIDPMLKKRPGPDDFDRNYGKKQPQ